MRARIAQGCVLVVASCLPFGCGDAPSQPIIATRPSSDDPLVRLVSLTEAPSELPESTPTAVEGEVDSVLDTQFNSESSHFHEVLQSTIRVIQTRSQVALHNLANAETVGFKRSRVLQTELSFRQQTVPGISDQLGNSASAGIAVGNGTQLRAIQLDMSAGALRNTDRQLDLAIDGEGFFQVNDPTGQILYTRCGAFARNNNGQLCLCSAGISRLVDPNITIPSDTLKVCISDEGTVSVLQAGSPQQPQFGQIQIARFLNPEGLQPLGEGLFAESQASGCPIVSNPGNKAAGKLRQGMLETLNVDPEIERAQLIQARQTLRMLAQLRARSSQN